MRKAILFLLSLGVCIAASADNTPRWLRSSAISPDGKTIAFAYQGDIYTVSSVGGIACKITSNPAYESSPVWSPDSKTLVYRSFREYSFDLWSIPAEGGAPTRLTTWAGSEAPFCIGPDSKVYFSAAIQDDPSYGDFPGRPQVWKVGLEGGKPERVTSIPMMNLSVSKEGVLLYEDYKGVEDPLRKHHTSSVTRDVWSLKDGVYTKLSTYVGENRNPVFASDGDTFWFLREDVKDNPMDPKACFNVWRSSLSSPLKQTKVTSFEKWPVRNLSASSDGVLLFSWNGDLYTCREGSAPVKVPITLLSDTTERETVWSSASLGIRSMAVSPNGKEIAVAARGEIYVTSTEAKSTRRITNTDVQERGVSFSGDGRSVYYASERDGEWGIWKSSLKNKDDKYMSLAYEFEEERVTKPGRTCFQPSVSPDGKWLAFLRDRADIVIMNLASGKEKVLLEGVNYSYSDGDQSFEWSPDSRYILCNYIADGGWNNSDVALIEVESGQVRNLTRSGYSDGSFHWALGGKAMTWESDKNGYRSHGSWGAEEDVYAMFFDAGAWKDFFKTKNEEDIEKLLKSDRKKSEAKKDSLKAEKPKSWDPDFESVEDRTIRLTRSAGRMGDHILSEDGKKLYYVVRLEKSSDLCCLNLQEGGIKVVSKGFSGRFVSSPDGKNVFVLSSLGVSKFDTKTGSTKSVSFSGEYEYHPAGEREYIFNHCWKQVEEKFYDPSIHSLDWTAVHENYARFLPYINNNYDFESLLSEMLGELNGSHTGARYKRLVLSAPAVGMIGALFDDAYDGKGLRIAEVLRGGELANADPEIAAGDVILAINGKEIPAGTSWYDAFTVHSRNDLLLTVKKQKGGKTDVCVTPKGSDTELLYKRWVRHNEELVERLSGGKVGYVHVRKMDSDSFREVYSKALGKYRTCGALIVDTRHNGGGWLHDDLVTFLGGKPYVEYRPRGQYIGTDPYSKWTKPSCVVMGEDNYSDACGFPYAYRALGLGKLIGAPVPGTMTAVWWETQVDGTLVFGIPQVTSWGLKENRPIENFQLEPDILVYNDPASVLRGEDRQLEAAVAEMLKEIK